MNRDKQQVETAQDRTYRVLQDYFNQNFELYGRTLALYVLDLGNYPNTTAGRRAAVAKADQEYQVFSVSSPEPEVDAETIRRKLVNFGSYQNPIAWYSENQPYAFSFYMDGDKILRLSTEMICKQLVGKPTSFGGPEVNGQDRKFGALVYEGEIHAGTSDRLRKYFADTCGGKLEDVVTFNTHTDGGAGNIGGAMTRMRANGVTSIIMFTDYASPALFTAAATQQGYFPEWISTGTGEADRNEIVRTFYDRQQWAHAIGITSLEISAAKGDTDYFKAYSSMDPSADPHDGVGRYVFPYLQQVVGALQMAGPKLTPETLQQGLLSRWPKRPPNPNWAVGGGYGQGDWTYSDYVTLEWWDPTGRDPEAPNSAGAYRHVFNGQRFGLGEIPTEPAPFFKEGISEAPRS